MRYILFIIIILASAPAFANNYDYKNALDKADKYLSNGNYQMVIRTLSKYSDQKHQKANAYIGDALRMMDKNTEAIESYMKAGNSPRALTGLGLIYFNGAGVAKDINKSLAYFVKAADNGGRMAMNILGEFYYIGKVVPENKKMAFYYWKSAVDLGYRPALKNLCRYTPSYQLVDSKLGNMCEQNGFGDW